MMPVRRTNRDTQVTPKPTRNPKSLTDDRGTQEAGGHSAQAGRTDAPGRVGVSLWGRRCSVDAGT